MSEPRYQSVDDWIRDQPWSDETKKRALDVVAQRDASKRKPLSFRQWMAWVRGRRG